MMTKSLTVIGLTGQSGAGKSAVASLLRARGLPVLDADEIYHSLLDSDTALRDELTAAFGTEILSPDGRVSRKKLADTVFGKPNTEALLHTLNKVTHKYVMSKALQQLRDLGDSGATVAVFDAPLLFEAGAEKICDFVVGVIAKRELRLSRIMARDGIDAAAAARRTDAQKTDEFYRARCDLVIENNEDGSALKEKVKELPYLSGTEHA